MSTPHIESLKEDISKVVLMPGDPLRAKYIADNYLQDVKLINTVRNMFGYTGYYRGRKITVFASGMGNPSMGIYSYELFKFYDVDYILRIGTAGAYTKALDVMDLLVVQDSYSDSSYAKVQNSSRENVVSASPLMMQTIKEASYELNKHFKVGRVYSSDVFYKDENSTSQNDAIDYGCLAVEMETFALFHNAESLNKNAACILTISDSFVSKTEITSEQREQGLDDMISLALEAAIRLL